MPTKLFALPTHPACLMGIMLLTLSGCATTNKTADNDPRDPLESINRVVFRVNQKLDHKIIEPIAQKYKDHVPAVAQTCISNVFSNLGEITTTANQLLQGHPGDASSDVSRFAVNSTVGVFGCFDPASSVGLEKHKKDFGGTLAVWGMPAGPYLVLPLIGASDFRDGIGLIPASLLDPTGHIKNVPVRMTTDGVKIVSTRAAALNPDQSKAPPADPYQAYRDSFFVKRPLQIYDGHPPEPQSTQTN